MKENAMSIKELDQALLRAKYGDAEEDVFEVIARMFNLEIAAVERVLYAASLIRRKDDTTAIAKLMDRGTNLSSDLKKAIDTYLQAGLARARVRWAIDNDKLMRIAPRRLIDTPEQICNGCPLSLICIANDLSTPERCYKAGPPHAFEEYDNAAPGGPRGVKGRFERSYNGAAMVRPIQLQNNKVTVACEHPKGRFVVDAEAFDV